ncbi:MAG: tyrosine--tRNA ligase [Phycisphaerales bacterium JB037]
MTEPNLHHAIDFLDEIQWRGLLFQSTDLDALRAHLASPRKLYAGFDPTADSLTIGNLVPIMVLVHAARAGHTPIVLMGGGTGLIGDPSGKTAERQLMTRERVAEHVEAQRSIFVRAFEGAGLPEPTIVNNLDWLGGLGYLDLLRDIGKHFSVNQMIQRESVKQRLESREQGISYTEFSYAILQAYDFLHLFREHGVTLQLGGSDQWGNIVSGIDLIRRESAAESDEHDAPTHLAHALTAPLVTKADGGKFGKTESGAIWLSAHRTSPYAYFQFWLNAADADIPKFLRIFTLMTEDEIKALEAEHAANPGARTAHRALAIAATTILHGPEEAELAERAGQALFSGDLASLPEKTFREVLAEVPSSEHDKSQLAGDGADPIDLLVDTGLAKSKREAREFLGNGSVSVNGEKISADDRLTSARLLHGSYLALRRGKKAWHLTSWK